MAGTSSLKFLFMLLMTSVVAYNLFLFHPGHYRLAPFLAAPRISVRNQPIVKFDVSFKLEDVTSNFSEESKDDAIPVASLRPAQSASLQHQNHTSWTTLTQMPPSNRSKLSLAAPTQSSGYILALKIYEQQTMATGNLLQLQCFASKLNLSVVQPLMRDSVLSTPLDSSLHSEMLQMEDVFNMQEWRQHTLSKGYASLVRWEEFIEDASRDVILMQMKHPTLSKIKATWKAGKPFPRPVSESKDYEQGCDYKNVDRAFEILRNKGFQAVRKVCYNFMSGDKIPLQVYQRDLFGGYDPSNVTVIMDAWRGLGENQRVLVEEKICPESHHYCEDVKSSSRVMRDAQHYIDKYLPHANVTGYLAVIARYEMTALTRWMKSKKNKSEPYAIIPFCLQETMKEIVSTRKEMGGGNDTFLSMDIGKYGSESFVKQHYFQHQKDLENFVSDVYGNEMNITDWERTFETIVETLDAGYIAKVQQAIVARAKCVLFVGGGTFQKHTLHLYQQLHPDLPDRCVRILTKCTSPYRPVQ